MEEFDHIQWSHGRNDTLSFLGKDISFLRKILGEECAYYKERLELMDAEVLLFTGQETMKIAIRPKNDVHQYMNCVTIYNTHRLCTKRDRIKDCLDMYIKYWQSLLQQQ